MRMAHLFNSVSADYIGWVILQNGLTGCVGESYNMSDGSVYTVTDSHAKGDITEVLVEKTGEWEARFYVKGE